MAATAPLVLPQAEQHAYDFWFTIADADRDGVVTPTEAVFLANSGLARPALAQVWGICADSRGLTRQGFYRAMRCVALGQKGMDMNQILPNHFTVVGLPVLQNVPQPPPLPQASQVAMPIPAPAPVVQPPASTPAPVHTPLAAPKPAPVVASAPSASVGPDWVISTEERARFEATFTRADTDRDGFVTGDQARELFTRSQLALSDLRKVWTLSDQDGDQKLSKEEFMISMYLITIRMKGYELPDALPPSLRASAAGQAPQGSATPLAALPSVPTAAPQSIVPLSTPSAPVSPAAPVTATAVLTPSGSSNSLLTAKIPPEELTQYGALFEQLDTDRDGFISGDQAKPILSMSNLPVPDLRQIWALADATGDYRLDKPEFVIAMYMINRRLRTGETIPDRLPASLTPQAVAYDLEPKASPQAAVSTQGPQSSLSNSGGEGKIAAPPGAAKSNVRNASRSAALERLNSSLDRERSGSLGIMQAPASPVSAYATPPPPPTTTTPSAVTTPPHLATVQRTSSGYGSPALASPAGAAASPSAYFGSQDDFAREERLRGEIDAKQAKVDATRAQVAQGEHTKEMGVKRLEELSQKSTELDRILAEMQQQLADQETAKADILREYQDEYDKMQLNLKKLDSLKSTILSNEKIKESTLKKLEETAASGAKLEAEANGYEKKVEGLTKDVREFQLKLDLEASKKESATSKVDFLRSKVADLEEQRRKLDAQLQDRNKSFQSEDASVQTLSSQITSATMLLEQQLAASKKISDDLNALKQKRQDMRSQLQDLQTQQTTESERTAKLLDEMSKTREEVNRLKPQVKEASKRLQATQEQQKALKAELADAKSDLTHSKDEIVAAQKSPRNGDAKPLPAVPPKSTTARTAVDTLPKPAAPPSEQPKPVPIERPSSIVAPPKKPEEKKVDEKKPDDKKAAAPVAVAPVATAAAVAPVEDSKRTSEDNKKEKKERSSRRSDRHSSHRPHKDKKTKESENGAPSNPFEAAKDAFANPFNFSSSTSDDPFSGAAVDNDPFDFDVPEADPLSFTNVKANLSGLEPRESFTVDTKNPFGADDFGGSRFSFGGGNKGDDPFA